MVTNRMRKPRQRPVPDAAPAPGTLAGEAAAAGAPGASAALAALADPTREAIVRLLAAGERSVGDIAGQLPVTRPAVSKHLRLLEGAGLVSHRSEGTRNLYALEPRSLEALRDAIDSLWRQSLARFAMVATNNPRRARRARNGDHSHEG